MTYKTKKIRSKISIHLLKNLLKFLNTIIKYMKNYTNIYTFTRETYNIFKNCSKIYGNTHINSQNQSCGIQHISVHVLATIEVEIITLLTNWLAGITG